MAEGDFQDRQNLLTRTKIGGKRGSEAMEYTLGMVRFFDLKRSIVNWTLPAKVDDRSIKRLDLDVAEQIHDKIAELNPKMFPSRDEEEEDNQPLEDNDGEQQDAISGPDVIEDAEVLDQEQPSTPQQSGPQPVNNAG